MAYSRKIIATVGVLLALGIAVYFSFMVPPPNETPGQGVACTMEAKQCPDGSYVGRIPPSCEFAACPDEANAPSSTPGIAPYQSGIQGRVMLGPTCPVMKNPPDPQCADKGYETLVAVFRAADPVHTVALFRSMADGTFKISLPPGAYTLGAGDPAAAGFPRCDHPSATVPPEGYAKITISCDTGIR